MIMEDIQAGNLSFKFMEKTNRPEIDRIVSLEISIDIFWTTQLLLSPTGIYLQSWLPGF